jgi:hypothetical protein
MVLTEVQFCREELDTALQGAVASCTGRVCCARMSVHPELAGRPCYVKCHDGMCFIRQAPRHEGMHV